MARVLIPNLDQVKAGFDPIPVGVYKVKIAAGEIKEGPKGQYIEWQFEIIEGEFASRKLFDNTSLMTKALFSVKSLLEAAGIPFDPEGFDTTDALGKPLNIKVSVGEYEGRPKNEIEAFLPA